MLVGIVLMKIVLLTQSVDYNASVCLQFIVNDLYFLVNTNFNDNDIKQQSIIYNYCRQAEIYCNTTKSVVSGSLIILNNSGCYAYQQSNIGPIDTTNITKGIKIQYRIKQPQAQQPTTYIKQFKCNGQHGAGCPTVDFSIIWNYFSSYQMSYTVTVEIIGVVFMVLGIYVYRITIILLGSATIFIMIVAIESSVIFIPGVPDDFIGSVLSLSAACSLLVGYIFGYFPKAGLVCMGMWIGSIVALTLNNIILYRIRTNPPNLALWIVMPILALVFGILISFLKKTFIIFATSLIGAYMTLRALSWYLGAFPNQFLIAKKYRLGLIGPVPWQFYLYVISLLILTASSSALQFWLFNKKMKRNNQTGDIEQHLQKMENDLKQQRQGIMQFNDVFKKNNKRGNLRNLKKQREQSDHSDENSHLGRQTHHQVHDDHDDDQREQNNSEQEQSQVQNHKSITKKLVKKK